MTILPVWSGTSAVVQVGFGGNNWLRKPTRFSDMVGDNARGEELLWGGGKGKARGEDKPKTFKEGLGKIYNYIWRICKEGMNGETRMHDDWKGSRQAELQ
jgi:hypothetical protein